VECKTTLCKKNLVFLTQPSLFHQSVPVNPQQELRDPAFVFDNSHAPPPRFVVCEFERVMNASDVAERQIGGRKVCQRVEW
jgi:hypothetical protein